MSKALARLDEAKQLSKQLLLDVDAEDHSIVCALFNAYFEVAECRTRAESKLSESPSDTRKGHRVEACVINAALDGIDLHVKKFKKNELKWPNLENANSVLYKGMKAWFNKTPALKFGGAFNAELGKICAHAKKHKRDILVKQQMAELFPESPKEQQQKGTKCSGVKAEHKKP